MTDSEMQCLEEAGEWVVRLQAGELSAEDIAEWVRWYEANPDHLQAFERLQGGWDALDALKREPRPKRPAVPWSWRKAALGLAAAAGIVAAVLLAFDRQEGQHGGRSLPEVTASESNRSAMLPDGSSLMLSTRTFVTVDYNGARRHLQLSKGEAFFKVRADHQRPFVVEAGEVSVTALGTAFDVRRDENRIVVTVEEGVVEVAGHSSADGSPPNRWRASAGYQVAWDRSERMARIALIDPAAMPKWREGQLAYLWEPLGLVIDDLNRYSGQQIVIRDKSIAELRYTGNVIPAAVDDWVTAITATYPVRAVRLANGDIALENAAR